MSDIGREPLTQNERLIAVEAWARSSNDAAKWGLLVLAAYDGRVAEVARLREALERIALGINGRRDDGLRPSEMDSIGMAKTDWMLAQAVLASGLSS